MAENLSASDLQKLGMVEISPGVYQKKTEPRNITTKEAEKMLSDPDFKRPNSFVVKTKQSPQQKMFAKGRMKKGVMNKTEANYARHLNALKFSGEILWWAYEAVTLKIAPDTRLTIDFTILYPSGRFVFHDTKGSMRIFQDDAKVKMKVAAEMFPFEFFVVIPRTQKLGGGFDIHQINPEK